MVERVGGITEVIRRALNGSIFPVANVPALPGAASRLPGSHFRHILEADHATVYTDRKPVCYTFQEH